MQTPDQPSAGAGHQVRGIDSLRFVAAAVVALSHGATLPLREYFPDPSGPARAAIALNELAFNGPVAVMVFFVISGFCIHYPFTGGARFRAGPFLVRRLLRIGLPLAAICVLAAAMGPKAQGALDVILWSLYCELIYYALYPLLRQLFARFGLWPCVIVATVASAGLIAANWGLRYHWSFTIWLTWLVALPPWLLGCVLAERCAGAPRPAPRAIWAWRAAVWLYATAALFVFYHVPGRIGHPALLAPFGFLAAAWTAKEIDHFRHARAWPALEWAGKWSFSLYLMHNVVIAITPIDPLHATLTWVVRIAAVAAGSLAFYAAVERPSHQLARAVSRRLGRPLRSGRGPASEKLAP